MDDFKEEYSKHLLSKEWLVKVDAAKSVPYLFKFCSVSENLCCLIVTDTKNVWAEVLSNKRMVRRWLECNLNSLGEPSESTGLFILDLISTLHSIGGISDVPFEVVESRDADLSFELDCDGFKWRWDAYLLGPKTSAEILSKHLILPLISIAHLSFYSADPVSELDESDLEKVVDKVGRSARRTVDIHVKHAVSKPRVSTTLQRFSALFDFNPLLPSIKSEVEKPSSENQLVKLRDSLSNRNRLSPTTRAHEEHAAASSMQPSILSDLPKSENSVSLLNTSSVPGGTPDSATEESDEDPASTLTRRKERSSPARSQSRSGLSAHSDRHPEKTNVAPSHSLSPAPVTGISGSLDADADSDSSPPRPVKKKHKTLNVSSSDSDEGGSSRIKGGGSQQTRGTGTTRGVRQPIKRGGKRF
ncbi:hypothetical protein BD410DRAFT_764954 [Rickenella mellea]|uniref:XLF-like N-terminal domain-containing protein n=1 Tax=Rickenella mellea TaxID=50990 RepID=A0A4Y7QE73_9AGAM|nr:hypothetical protein BD410DRAFT_764954 [Rickenella mellea]